MSDPRSDHLDLDALADHLAGEVNARPHLEACAGCAARLAELEAAEQRVVAALATLAPPPLPAAVGDRIAAALAAEPTLTAADAPAARRTAEGNGGAATGSVLHLGERRSAARRRTWLPAAAAGVVLVAGGLVGYSVVAGTGSPNDMTAASDSAGASASTEVAPASAVPTLSSGLDYADAAAVATTLPQALAGEQADTMAMAPESEAPEPEASDADAPEAQDGGPALAALRDPAVLDDCLSALLPPEQPDLQPVALDYASYDGAPALAVLLPDADPAKLAVFVVGPGCSQADEGLLFFTRVDRP